MHVSVKKSQKGEIKMNFKEFTEKVIEEIKDYLPEEYAEAEINVTRILKENIERTGLNIRKSDEKVTPTIYLEEFFELYKHDNDIEEVLMEISKMRTSHEENKPEIDYAALMEWESVKTNIVPALMNLKLNEELLKNLVHKKLGDMAIYYRIVIEGTFGIGTVKISHQLLERYGVTGKQLYEQAIENLDKYFGRAMSFREVREELGICLEIAGERDFVIIRDQQEPGPVGAANVLNFKLCDKAADILGRDEIILIPSSKHEMLAVPMDMDEWTIKEMIETTNASEVDKEDILSYIPYKYSTETKQLTVYGDWE